MVQGAEDCTMEFLVSVILAASISIGVLGKRARMGGQRAS
jgi:hypothetical protein